jgi:hypothetical protein
MCLPKSFAALFVIMLLCPAGSVPAQEGEMVFIGVAGH